MERLISMSSLLAATACLVAGCSMMPGGNSTPTSPATSASTREQCRQQSAMIGTTHMRRNDATARRDSDCATMMPN